jgi:subtilisin family serine protease
MLALLVTSLVLSGATTLPQPPAPSSPPEARTAVLVQLAGDGAPPPETVRLLSGPDFTVTRSYRRLAAVAGLATPAGLARLRALPSVRSVVRDELGHVSTSESGPLIGSTQLRARYGFDGRGVTVAVLDTGADSHHPDLGDGGVPFEKCFVLNGCEDGGSEGDLAPDVNGHGTHVTGTITSDGSFAPPGIAPGAAVVPVLVFDTNSIGRVSDWVAALDWVLATHGTNGIRAVNMSLGTDALYPGTCDTDQPTLTDAITRLRAEGVLTFAATGNDGSPDSMSAPACVSTAVAVGAVYDADLGAEPDNGTYLCGCSDDPADAGAVICFSNSGEHLRLLAPGSRITSTVPHGVGEKRGTSQATPHATAAAALLLQYDPGLAADALEGLLRDTGVPTLDPKNGRTAPRVDVRAALAQTAATWCARKGDGAECSMGIVCDGGPCDAGTCAAGVCSFTVPAMPPFPAARGCAVGGVGGVGALAVWLWTRRRRRRG